jgi:hypothetical protein
MKKLRDIHSQERQRVTEWHKSYVAQFEARMTPSFGRW